MASKFAIRRFDGNDAYSWAVFHKRDVTGTKASQIIFYGQAKPIASGCCRTEAKSIAQRFEKKEQLK